MADEMNSQHLGDDTLLSSTAATSQALVAALTAYREVQRRCRAANP